MFIYNLEKKKKKVERKQLQKSHFERKKEKRDTRFL